MLHDRQAKVIAFCPFAFSRSASSILEPLLRRRADASLAASLLLHSAIGLAMLLLGAIGVAISMPSHSTKTAAAAAVVWAVVW